MRGDPARYEVALVDANGVKRSRFSVGPTAESLYGDYKRAGTFCAQYRKEWWPEIREIDAAERERLDNEP